MDCASQQTRTLTCKDELLSSLSRPATNQPGRIQASDQHRGRAFCSAFTIDQVTLTLLPGTTVERGTNVTMRCEARVSQSQPQPLMYSFNFTQDDQVVYSKNISDLVVERSISPARVSNSGRYMCTVSVNTKYKKSGSQTLKVTGLQTPVMKVKSDIISEGEEIIATCSAPEETGSFIFSFYENGQEIKQTLSVKNYVETLLTVNKLSDTYLNCKYQLMQHPNAGSSNKSNTVKIVVRDLEEITPAIFIKPKQNVVEGDRVQFECRVPYSYDLELFLTKESTILKKLHTTFTHNFMVRAEDSGDYVCKAEKGSVQKTATDHLSVAELFSRPVLRMIPEQVFEGQQFHLVCSSAINSTQRIRKEDLKYVLLKEDRHISTQASYINTASLTMNGKYSCVAEAKGINKTSLPLLFKAKVPVSTPVIRNVGKVIVGRPFRVMCEAENGTLPITYTLLKSLSPVAQMTVSSPADKAIFDIPSIRYLEDISTFSCQAHNQGSHMSSSSASLQAAVIVPVSKPVLTVESKGFTVTEGSDLTLICSVQQGTDPITFTWYHNGVVIPSSTQKVTRSQGTHVVVAVEREQRGNYYCDATNDATETKRSPPVTIGVSLAVWKKALIGVFCLLLLVAIIIVLIVFFKKMSNPRKKKQATELSVKPSRPKSGDPMRISLTLDIEDNTALNGTPCVMGRNVWSENVSGSESDDPAEEDSKLVYPQEVDPSRDDVPVKKATEPEHNVQCTEAQVSTPGVLEQAEGQAALEYAQLNNSEQEPQSLVST